MEHQWHFMRTVRREKLLLEAFDHCATRNRSVESEGDRVVLLRIMRFEKKRLERAVQRDLRCDAFSSRLEDDGLKEGVRRGSLMLRLRGRHVSRRHWHHSLQGLRPRPVHDFEGPGVLRGLQ